MTMKKRESGFYWVKWCEGDDWEVAECVGDVFYIIGCELPRHESRMYQIDERRITREEHPLGTWVIGTRLRKKSGSSWQGRVVGYYSTSLTHVGYCIESEREPGSVQIYPASALEVVPE